MAVAALAIVGVLSGCARWPARPSQDAVTSFDDLIPANVASVVYCPNLPESQERFRATELARRLGRQKADGLWRSVDFLRPWAASVFEQTTDQVDELIWGNYRSGNREQWFLVARLNQPSRRVLNFLHRRTLPKVAKDFRRLELVRSRYRGRRIFEWVRKDGGDGRLVTYALLGRVVVMGSDRAYVRAAVERRPGWLRYPRTDHDEVSFCHREQVRDLLAGYEPGDDLYAWFQVDPATLGGEAAPSRWKRLADRMRQTVASHLDAVRVGLRITPPAITGRWGLVFRRPPRPSAVRKEAVPFAPLCPESTRRLVALHDLPLDHPLFRDLRSLPAELWTGEILGPVRGALRFLRLLPGIGDVPRILESLEGRVAYCSFGPTQHGTDTRATLVDAAGRSGAGARNDGPTARCLMVALENAAVVATALRSVPFLLRRVLEKSEYHGRPIGRLRTPLPGPAGDLTLAVCGDVLVIAPRNDTVHRLIDAAESSRTLEQLPVVAQVSRFYGPDLLAEFYSGGRENEMAEEETSRASTDDVARFALSDRRLLELAGGGSYSVCLQQRDGVEIVTCSATGFHWTVATMGLASAVLHALPIAQLLQAEPSELLHRVKEEVGGER